MSLIEKAAAYLKLPGRERPDGRPEGPPRGAARGAGGDPAGAGPAMAPRVDIDLAGLAAAGFIMPGQPSSLLAEELRVIKRPLLANARAGSAVRHANLIMVTSALAGEGKSFTALNLALSIAMELERTVLLVDADVARPSLPSMLGVPAQSGLLDMLHNRSLPLGEVLLRTNVEKLNLLMAGTRAAQATEMLASEAMARLLDEMANRYADRIIVFDSPPLLMTTEAQVLATHMGQIVFVLQAEESLHSATRDALATIASCPVKLLVLNRARPLGRLAHGYQYGPAYGYGYAR
ncbi:protein-tyrosine kinase [Janthinobacterium sp. CG_23.3]|uniref:XrtA-associated tyrosine autokinase n=1 Tax=Janthinobacterium sp. CG_23.3 TaxID=3349634 RepID=UPI0038D50FEE